MTSRTPLEDRIAAMVQSVTADIRHKVVEEPWYGREVTSTLGDIHQALDRAQAQTQERGQEPGMDRFYGRDAPAEQEREPEQGFEHGIDR